MAINKIGIKQYAETNANTLSGVTFVYVSTNGESAVNLNGEDFTPANKTNDEIFRVWKNALKIHWDLALILRGLKKDNGGIRGKLRSTTPAYIVVRTKSGEVAFRWSREASVFDSVGIMPTLADIKEVEEERAKNKDYKQKMHRAASASFNALKLKFKFEKATDVAETSENIENAE